MAENRRYKDKRFYFSRGQLVLLGGAFTLASLMIFLLGIVVGRGIEERKMARPEEPLIKIPVKPSTQSGGAASAGQAKEELTFYDTLGKSSRTAPSLEEKADEPKEAEKAIKPEPKEVKSKGREECDIGVAESRGEGAAPISRIRLNRHIMSNRASRSKLGTCRSMPSQMKNQDKSGLIGLRIRVTTPT